MLSRFAPPYRHPRKMPGKPRCAAEAYTSRCALHTCLRTLAYRFGTSKRAHTFVAAFNRSCRMCSSALRPPGGPGRHRAPVAVGGGRLGGVRGLPRISEGSPRHLGGTFGHFFLSGTAVVHCSLCRVCCDFQNNIKQRLGRRLVPLRT